MTESEGIFLVLPDQWAAFSLFLPPLYQNLERKYDFLLNQLIVKYERPRYGHTVTAKPHSEASFELCTYQNTHTHTHPYPWQGVCSTTFNLHGGISMFTDMQVVRLTLRKF